MSRFYYHDRIEKNTLGLFTKNEIKKFDLF